MIPVVFTTGTDDGTIYNGIVGIGIASIRNDKHAADDSFGLVALCSIGPVLAVMILGMIYRPAESSYSAAVVPEVADSVELWHLLGVVCHLI